MDRLKETCMAALQGYGLQGAEVVHALRGMRSVAHGFASLEAAGALKHSVSPDDSYAWLVETFLAGLESMASLRRKKLRSPDGYTVSYAAAFFSGALLCNCIPASHRGPAGHAVPNAVRTAPRGCRFLSPS